MCVWGGVAFVHHPHLLCFKIHDMPLIRVMEGRGSFY